MSQTIELNGFDKVMKRMLRLSKFCAKTDKAIKEEHRRIARASSRRLKRKVTSYNKDINVIWDDIKDFIRLHYISPRQDTNFWKDVSNTKISNTLKDRLDIWKSRMPRYADYGINNFYELGNTLWYQILIGMKILNKDVALNELESFKLLNYAEELYANTMDLNNQYFKNLISNQEYYVPKK